MNTDNMNGQRAAEAWATRLGLVELPLFSNNGVGDLRQSIILDGARGSFAVSEGEGERLQINDVASWAWSADVPHHVAVSRSDVTVVRWDDFASTRRFSLTSVDSKLDAFYEYLRLDAVRSRLNVVDHSVDVFRRTRSAVADRGLPDESSIHCYLYLLGWSTESESLTHADVERIARENALDLNYANGFLSIGESRLRALRHQLLSSGLSGSNLQLVPELMVRHASGTVFQEAHYELLRLSPADLFSLHGSAGVATVSRGGTHFTPPVLARAVAEQALRYVDLQKPLTVLDPACGAGAFLLEALRVLMRVGYTSKVTVIGFDSSPSAIAMAQFVLKRARDECEAFDVAVELKVADSIAQETEWPDADVVLMNPPFISWANLDRVKRAQVKAILGNRYSGSPDYSIAFIDRAVRMQKPSVVGTLLPAALLSVGASLPWRRALARDTSIRLIASIGDHSMFRHALVEVAALVCIPADADGDSNETVLLWSSEKDESGSEGLRHLRKSSGTGISGLNVYNNDGSEWTISFYPQTELVAQPDWRPRPNRLGAVLPRIRQLVDSKVGDLFHVREGIRAGNRKVFLLNASEYSRLPDHERHFFKPVAENRNIREARIGPHGYIFYPYDAHGPILTTEDELKESVPRYYRDYLLPKKEDLQLRTGLGKRPWWQLNRPRKYFYTDQTKIVTSFFGDRGSFALDKSGSYVVVQGFAWFPTKALRRELDRIPAEIRDSMTLDMFLGYLALLNSRLFSLLLGEYCPHVAGGQYNLSKRFVNSIPLPNLALGIHETAELGGTIASLARIGRSIHAGEMQSAKRLDELAAEVYRVPLHLWPVELTSL